jgi:hypothetical protein
MNNLLLIVLTIIFYLIEFLSMQKQTKKIWYNCTMKKIILTIAIAFGLSACNPKPDQPIVASQGQSESSNMSLEIKDGNYKTGDVIQVRLDLKQAVIISG